MVNDATAGAMFRVLAKWVVSLEVYSMDEPLPTITITANMPQNDLLDLLKVLTDASA